MRSKSNGVVLGPPICMRLLSTIPIVRSGARWNICEHCSDPQIPHRSIREKRKRSYHNWSETVSRDIPRHRLKRRRTRVLSTKKRFMNFENTSYGFYEILVLKNKQV